MNVHLLDDFKEAMAGLAGGVCAVTTVGVNGRPVGFAATSVTSVSLRPPLLLVCQAKTSGSYPVFASCKHFGISVLAADQQELAALFAEPGADRFAGTGFRTGRYDVPLHPAALATVQCRRRETVDTGDHGLLIGEVRAVHSQGGEPLVYHCRQYQRLAPV